MKRSITLINFANRVLASKYLALLLPALSVFLLDRVSKVWVVEKTITLTKEALQVKELPNLQLTKLQLPSLELLNLQLGELGLALSLSFNRGVAFGFLAKLGDNSQLPIIILSLAIALLFAKFALDAQTRTARFAASLIFGGAIGNIYDRLRYHGVLDFIDAYAYGYHWYKFNLADAAISIGVALWLIVELAAIAKETKEQPNR